MSVSIEKQHVEQRLQSLETHLQQENPVLLDVVKSFRLLDKVAYGLGLMEQSESFATRVPWWPMVSILGTFSSGKSSFINYYLREKLQSTGNQAVDDKFTVICYSSDNTARMLPGLALDADPRFPFYQISEDIERVTEGEGRRVDAYLQLKTCPSQMLHGKIFIDSPGFDADAQRTSTLRITDHIINLSDLVLVFFDARHPEPGAMQDTLKHLVADTINRPDSNKFLYILNQLDTTAKEDNPEAVVAAWQRALAQQGLTAGRFYQIYNPDVANPIDDPQLCERFERKRDEDLADIRSRVQQVEVERAYRIIGVLEETAKSIESNLVPAIREAKEGWRQRVLRWDGIIFGVLGVFLLVLTIQAGYWDGLSFAPPWLSEGGGSSIVSLLVLAIMVGGAGYIHFTVRKLAANAVIKGIRRNTKNSYHQELLVNAFRKNSGPLRSIFLTHPAGWGRGAAKKIVRVITDADNYVQTLNNKFTDPSSRSAEPPTGEGTKGDIARKEEKRQEEPEQMVAPAQETV